MSDVKNAFMVTAVEKKHCSDSDCVKCAGDEAKKLSKKYLLLQTKVHGDADKAARAAGHAPSKEKHANDSYLNAVDHHIAHHKDIKQLSELKQASAKAKVKHKRLLRSHKTESSILSAFKCPITAANELGEKISKHADAMARKDGYAPSADEDKQNAYDRAVIDYTASHPDYDRWADLSSDAVLYGRGNKTEASLRTKEIKAFLGFTKTKEPHTFGKTAGEARSNAKHWTKKANSLHSKIHNDAIKKAVKSGYNIRHKDYDHHVSKNMENHPDHNHFQNLRKISDAHRRHYKKAFGGVAHAQDYYRI